MRLVRIARLVVDAAVRAHVLERLVHKATLAALVTVAARAVDEVLLAQRDQSAFVTEVLALQGSGLKIVEKISSPGRSTLRIELVCLRIMKEK